MTENQRKAELARLNEDWKKETHKIKKYRLLLQGAEERRAKIEEKIKNL